MGESIGGFRPLAEGLGPPQAEATKIRLRRPGGNQMSAMLR